MTATAFSLDPALDLFDEVDAWTTARPELRLIQGQGADRIRHIPALASSIPGASVELYRRRRFFALLAATVLVLVIAWAAGVSVTTFTATAGDVPIDASVDALPVVHLVLPGDSYAAIASDLGAQNPVAGAQVLRAANGDSELVVGQRLVIDAALLSVAG